MDYRLQAPDLECLIQAIRNQGYLLYGPTLNDRAITYGEIHSVSSLPQGWTDDQQAGQYRVKRRGTKPILAMPWDHIPGRNICNCLAGLFGRQPGKIKL